MQREQALKILSNHKIELRHKFGVKSIAIFGSTARNEARSDSDVDILVIMESDLSFAHRSAEVSLACRPKGLAVDFLVKTPTEVAHRLNIRDPFLKRILDGGKVLYAR